MAETGRPAASGAVFADGGSYLLVGLFVLVALFPFYWMLRTAFTPARPPSPSTQECGRKP